MYLINLAVEDAVLMCSRIFLDTTCFALAIRLDNHTPVGPCSLRYNLNSKSREHPGSLESDLAHTSFFGDFQVIAGRGSETRASIKRSLLITYAGLNTDIGSVSY